MKEILLRVLTEFVLGYLLQSAACIILLYVFSARKVRLRSFFIFTFLLAIEMYIVRNCLPINFGVHTILSMITIILIGIWVFKMQPYRTIIAAFVSSVLISLSELIVFFTAGAIIGTDTMLRIKAEKGYEYILVGDIASLLFFVMVLTAYIFLILRKKIK